LDGKVIVGIVIVIAMVDPVVRCADVIEDESIGLQVHVGEGADTIGCELAAVAIANWLLPSVFPILD
jgi:hypothetical protein